MSFDFSNLDLNIILIPCSGSEYHGEIAHKAAIKLMEDGPISEISSDLEAFKNMPKLTNIKEEEINKVISHLLLKLKEKILLIRKEIVK
ncbi:MAG: hypothetical protein ACTSRH_13075 [Promethearchaeota archaeon]